MVPEYGKREGSPIPHHAGLIRQGPGPRGRADRRRHRHHQAADPGPPGARRRPVHHLGRRGLPRPRQRPPERRHLPAPGPGPAPGRVHDQPGASDVVHPPQLPRPRASGWRSRSSSVTIRRCSWPPSPSCRASVASSRSWAAFSASRRDGQLQDQQPPGPGPCRDRHRGLRRHGPDEGPERRPLRRVPAVLHATWPHAVAPGHRGHDAQAADLRGRLQRPPGAPRPRRPAADGRHLPPRPGVDARPSRPSTCP